MQIRIDKLQGRSCSFEIDETVDAFPSLMTLSEQGVVVFKGVVTGSLAASVVGDIVRIEGHIAARIVMTCSRCLVAVERLLDVPLNLCYQQQEPSPEPAGPDEVELTLSDLELIPCQGDELDPRPEIAQELIMALPQSILCREDCAGLCPVCGTDLNQNACRCETPVFHEGLVRLKDFKPERG